MQRQTTPRGRQMLVAGILVLVALSAWRLSDPPPGKVRGRWSGRAMGTTWTVKLGSHAPAEHGEAVGDAIAAVLSRVEQNLSTYVESSDVVRLSRAPADTPIRVSKDAIRVLLLAEEVSRLTSGAFDVTVAPLVRAWGFGAGAEGEAPPEPERVRELLGAVGFTHLRIDPDARLVEKRHTATEVDLSAIAKGYGVDEVARMLEHRGLHDYLVEVGGELRVAGERSPGQAWRLAIEQPSDTGRAVHRTFALPAGGSLATSGDYRNFYVANEKRVSHTIDPRTGQAIATNVASASVVAPECALSDALATAVGVLGADRALELADREAWAIYLLEREGDKLVPRQSRAFTALMESQP